MPPPRAFTLGDVRGTDGLGVFEAPSQTVERHLLIQLLERIEERRDVLVVTDVLAERNSPLDQLGDIPLHQLAHLLRLDDDGRTVEVLVIVYIHG